jgi:hypothetical protein
LYRLEGDKLQDYNDFKTLVEMQISWMTEDKRCGIAWLKKLGFIITT